MQQGWIKLHRSIMESETFLRLTSTQKLIAIYIVLNTNHQDGIWYDKYKDIEVPIKRGQLIVSRNKIANEWFKGDKEVTEQKVRTTLKKLEKLGFLTSTSTNSYTLLEVLNYSVYQGNGEETSQVSNQVSTKSQPSDNQVSTTNKNVFKNELRMDKNEKETKNPYPNEFEQFWSVYPRKVDKKKAYTKFKAALKRHPLEKILEGTERYAEYTKGKNPDYIKHASTFLNNDSFIDGYEEPKLVYQKSRGQVVNMFTQSEESRKRQKAAEESVTEETMAELKKTLGEMPY